MQATVSVVKIPIVTTTYTEQKSYVLTLTEDEAIKLRTLCGNIGTRVTQVGNDSGLSHVQIFTEKIAASLDKAGVQYKCGEGFMRGAYMSNTGGTENS